MENTFSPRVVNLSKCNLSDPALNLLHKGLKYAPALPISTKTYKNLAADCEVALSGEILGTKQLMADIISADMKKTPSNFQRPSTDAATLENLSTQIEEEQLTIIRADNGNSIVILDKENYI
ncbi:uncharacterized protein, partial [Hetaerina americana]